MKVNLRDDDRLNAGPSACVRKSRPHLPIQRLCKIVANRFVEELERTLI
jgi:hypothetical protein